MIRICTPDDLDFIYSVIADGSPKYRGIIPAGCWKEPYVSLEELISEISSGVIFGFTKMGRG